ncbi:MAG: hypothetical protein EA391_03350 [Balneolaceae bacterium]|nr:MAG: hypothetical protein EA391_03350 [Balneolaceae bacterium]
MALSSNNFKRTVISIVFIILLLALMLSRVFRPSVSTSPQISIIYNEAVHHIGTTAEVCGDVVSATFARNVGGQPTFINFGDDYPNQVFTVVIWGEYLTHWRTPPADLYSDRFVCARGRITLHNDVPQIVVSQPDQISFSRRY